MTPEFRASRRVPAGVAGGRSCAGCELLEGVGFHDMGTCYQDDPCPSSEGLELRFGPWALWFCSDECMEIGPWWAQWEPDYPFPRGEG